MSKLVVKGKAEKEYVVDAMKVKLSFKGVAESTAEAIKKVNEAFNTFLKELIANNIDISNFTIEEIRISPSSYSSGDKGVTARREIKINTNANIKLCAYFVSLIKNYDFTCDFDVSFFISDTNQIRKELLEAAMNDSKVKAETLAKSVGKTIIGIKDICNSDYSHRSIKKSITVDNVELPVFAVGDDLVSELALPTRSEDEEVEVTWLVE